jgi:hypothetical protein
MLKAHNVNLPQDYRAENNAHHWQRASDVKNETAALAKRSTVRHSRAGPATPACNQNAMPALAGEFSYVMPISSVRSKRDVPQPYQEAR